MQNPIDFRIRHALLFFAEMKSGILKVLCAYIFNLPYQNHLKLKLIFLMWIRVFLFCFSVGWQAYYSLLAGFYKPTIPQSPPSLLQDYSTCNNARLEFSTVFVPRFDPNECCLKNGLHSRGIESRTSWSWVFCLTTRPRVSPARNVVFFILGLKNPAILSKILSNLWAMPTIGTPKKLSLFRDGH